MACKDYGEPVLLDALEQIFPLAKKYEYALRVGLGFRGPPQYVGPHNLRPCWALFRITGAHGGLSGLMSLAGCIFERRMIVL